MTRRHKPDFTTREFYYEALIKWSGCRVIIHDLDGRVAAVLEPDPQDPTLCHATLARPIPGLDQDASWRCLPGAVVERVRPEAT